MNRFFTHSLRALTAGLILAVGACSFDEVLTVENPDELLEDNLNNPRFIDVLVASVKGDLAEALDDPFIWRGSMFTDETLTGINWEQTARLNQRIVQYDEGDADLMFSELSRARAQADSISGRLRSLLESPSTDERMAKVLAYAGFANIFLGDAMCECVVDQGSEVLTSMQMYERAVTRLDEALTIATTAGDDDLANLARVGLT
ncbi:MAG: hypothetical protein HKO98_13770, partial [Gemmatimonadetes bacterium]|nr:hypothetical protein [Gemmatimonadota bacterium]